MDSGPPSSATPAPADFPGGSKLSERRWPTLREAAVATYVAALLGDALYVRWAEPTDLSEFSLLLVWNVFPAAVYVLGYAVFLPELVGRRPRSSLSLNRRWDLFLQVSGLLALGCLLVWASVVFLDDQGMVLLLKMLIGAIAAFCAGTVMVILSKHFHPVPVREPEAAPVRPWVVWLRALGAPAHWLAHRLRPRVSLISGSVLVLVSLVLVTSVDGCTSDYRGYEVLSREGGWLTANHMNSNFTVATVVTDYTGWITYALALVIAALTLIFLIRSPRQAIWNRSHIVWLVGASGSVALFNSTDLGLFFLPVPWEPVSIALRFFCWFVPPALWVHCSLSPQDPTRLRWPITRSSLAVFLLPIVLDGFGTLILAADGGVFGYVSYFLGIHLLWCGYTQLLMADQAQGGAATDSTLASATVGST